MKTQVKAQFKADLMLLMVTLCWGSSYLFMKMGLNSVQEFNLIALRFGLAFLFSAIVFYKRLINADFKTVRHAFLLGVILFSAFTFIIFGVKSTSISNAGFLMSLTVAFVPLLSALFFKQTTRKKSYIRCLFIHHRDWPVNFE